MPWHRKPTKDATSCDKLRREAHALRPADLRMGEPAGAHTPAPPAERICRKEATRRTETSQYPEEEKENIDFLSSGDRKGKSLNRLCYGTVGVVGAFKGTRRKNGKTLENVAAEGESPVPAESSSQECHLSRAGHVKSCLNPRGPSRKAKYFRKTDSEPVP